MKRLNCIFSLMVFSIPHIGYARPQGCVPISGEGECVQIDALITEVRTSDTAVLHWDSFSINANETMRFIMPHVASSVLNRVMQGEMSQILGKLESNGRLFLINPKGVLIGKDATINTASFIASSFDVLDEDFLKGGDHAFQGDTGAIINLGKITACNGDVTLIGREVINRGVIDAQHSYTASGRIFLIAEEGTLEVQGRLTAPAGEIHLLGDRVNILSGTHIDVSDLHAGGSVLIGGTGASSVHIEEGAFITADALIEGNGGTVTVWSLERTEFFGAITSQGGNIGGNGGFVEVSGGSIVPCGFVNTLAAYGNNGELLLDPCTVIISREVDLGFTMAPDYTFTSTNSNINTTSLQGYLTSSNVTINASSSGSASTGSITIQSPLSWTSGNALTLTANDSMASTISFLSNVTAPQGSLILNGSIVSIGNSHGESTSSINVFVNNATINSSRTFAIYAGISCSSTLQVDTATLNLSNEFLLQGGSGSYAYALLESSGDVTVNGGINAMITAGTGTACAALLQTNSGNITFTDISQLQLTGSSKGSNAFAAIQVSNTGNININTQDLNMTAGGVSGANAIISTHTSSDDAEAAINITASGSMSMQGGSSSTPLSSSSAGQVMISTSSSQGNITLSADNGISLTAGSGISAFAEISAPQAMVSISTGGNLVMKSATSESSTQAYTAITGGNLVEITADNLMMTGGAGPQTYARIETQDGAIQIGTSNNPLLSLALQGGTAKAGASDVSIRSLGGGAIDIEANAMQFLSGTGMSSAALIQSGTRLSGNNISLNSQGTIVFTGSKSSPATVITGNGQGYISIQGTTGTQLTDTLVVTNGIQGNNSIALKSNEGDVILSNVLLKTYLGEVILIANEEIQFLGTTKVVANVPANGFVTSISGTITFLDSSNIFNINGTNPTLVFVVDNEHPTSPNYGTSNLLKYPVGATALLSNGTGAGQVRLYTSVQNPAHGVVNGANINGLVYTPGTEFVDTDQEVWGVYYPDVPAAPENGSNHFTIYYKNLSPAPVPAPAPSPAPPPP